MESHLFRRLGLNQYQAKALSALLSAGSVTASELASIAALPRPRVYDVAESLCRAGLVAKLPGKPIRYSALPIKAAAEELKLQRRRALEAELKAIDEAVERLHLQQRLQKKQSVKEAGDEAWIVEGGALRAKLIDMLTRGGDVLIASSDHALSEKIALLSSLGNRLKRVRLRILSPTPLPDALPKKAFGIGNFEHLVVDVPMPFVATRGEALLYLSDGCALWARSERLAQLLHSFAQQLHQQLRSTKREWVARDSMHKKLTPQSQSQNAQKANTTESKCTKS